MTSKDVADQALIRMAFLISADSHELTDRSESPSRRGMRLHFDRAPGRPCEIVLEAFDDDCPRVEVLLRRLDAPRSPAAPVLEFLNRLHRAGRPCAASVAPDSGLIEVRSTIVFTGYQDDPTCPGDRANAPREALLNLLLQVCRLGELALVID